MSYKYHIIGRNTFQCIVDISGIVRLFNKCSIFLNIQILINSWSLIKYIDKSMVYIKSKNMGFYANPIWFLPAQNIQIIAKMYMSTTLKPKNNFRLNWWVIDGHKWIKHSWIFYSWLYIYNISHIGGTIYRFVTFIKKTKFRKIKNILTEHSKM